MPHKPLSPNLIKDIFMQTWQGPEQGTLLITKAASGWAITPTFASLSTLCPEASSVQAKICVGVWSLAWATLVCVYTSIYVHM